MMLLFDTINIMASEILGGMRMKYSIAICDDSKTDAALVQSFLLEWAKQRGTEVEIEVFPSAESFLFRYDEYKAFDILLFDVEMSGMDGVSAARKVRRENEAVQIVFITGYSDYIAEGYDVAALHYLMKPLNKEKFFSVLNRAAQKSRRTNAAYALRAAAKCFAFRYTRYATLKFSAIMLPFTQSANTRSSAH